MVILFSDKLDSQHGHGYAGDVGKSQFILQFSDKVAAQIQISYEVESYLKLDLSFINMKKMLNKVLQRDRKEWQEADIKRCNRGRFYNVNNKSK